MLIRPCAPSERGAVVDLWRTCSRSISCATPEAEFDRALAGPHSTVLAGEHDGRIVASVMLGDGGHRGWIDGLAVAPPLQGHGIGREMVRAAESWLSARGCREVVLMVREGDERALGFCERIGYAPERTVVMSRRLAEPGTPAGVQFIDGPDGRPRYAVLPVEEYERLATGSSPAPGGATGAVPDASMPTASGSRDTVEAPAEVAARVAAGENPILVWREHRGLTREILAGWIGFGEEDVEAFETGEIVPTVEICTLIAHALDIGIDDVVPHV